MSTLGIITNDFSLNNYSQGIRIIFLYTVLPKMLDKEELMFSAHFQNIDKEIYCFYIKHSFLGNRNE